MSSKDISLISGPVPCSPGLEGGGGGGGNENPQIGLDIQDQWQLKP